MIHELGHALGLPHVKNASYSDFMIPAGFGCDRYYIDNICKFTDYDFETFLDLFPAELMTREELVQWKKKQHIESLIQERLSAWDPANEIECTMDRAPSFCASMRSLYYNQRDRLREYYYGGQYDADLRRKKAQEWIDKFGGYTDTSYYRDRVNNRK